MKKLLALIVILHATAALAQQDDTPPPAPAGKAAHAKKATAAKGAPSNKSLAEKLLACLDLDDETKDRLDCYDAAIPPKPKPKSSPANGVMDCRYVKEGRRALEMFQRLCGKNPKVFLALAAPSVAAVKARELGDFRPSSLLISPPSLLSA